MRMMQELTRDGSRHRGCGRACCTRSSGIDWCGSKTWRALLGTTTADAQARADLVNVASGHLQETMNALMLASGEHVTDHV